MDPVVVPLVDELASALDAAREELRRAHQEQRQPDMEIVSQAEQALGRFELERDRTDLDAATLPARIIIVLEDGQVTAVMTDSRMPIEVGIIDYDLPGSVAVPQQPNEPAQMAHGQLLLPHVSPERTRELYLALHRGEHHTHVNNTEH